MSSPPLPLQQGPVLVTGAAGFIGMHLSAALMSRGIDVVGIDNLNAYYPVALKEGRLAELERHGGPGRFRFEKIDLADTPAILSLFEREGFQHVVHLGAQAGVRYSLIDPFAYAQSNLVGMTNILEASRRASVRHLVYASSSSVYGGNEVVPFSEQHAVDHPVSLYAATKKANEVMAHSYSHLFGLPTSGLRFFTVYGPWGRPDMAYWMFTEALLRNEPIKVFEKGVLARDFTYVDDIVDAIVRLLERPPAGQADGLRRPDRSTAPFAIYNIGNSAPTTVNEMIAILEEHTGRTAQRIELPMQPGDVERTFADPSALAAVTGFKPSTPLRDGLDRFVKWYRNYHQI